MAFSSVRRKSLTRKMPDKEDREVSTLLLHRSSVVVLHKPPMLIQATGNHVKTLHSGPFESQSGRLRSSQVLVPWHGCPSGALERIREHVPLTERGTSS